MPKPILPIIAGSRINLRPLEEEDLPQTLSWRNATRIRKMFINSNVIEFDNHKSWYDLYKNRDNDFLFVIQEIAELKRNIGQIGIYDIDFLNRSAEYGRLLIGDEEALKRGYAEEASEMLLRYCDTELQLTQVFLEVKTENHNAHSLYKKLGFQEIRRTDLLITMLRSNQAL
jgi:diamine N-acetyltransferase